MNRKVRFAVLSRLPQLFFTIVILVCFLFSCKPHKKISDVDTAIDNALHYIAVAQTVWGGFPTERCLDDAMGRCITDKTLFVPVLIGLCLQENHNDKAKAINQRLSAMLAAQQGRNGAWEFYFREPGSPARYYFPDLDDTTLISRYLIITGAPFNADAMKNAVFNNKKDGRYLTFLRDYQAPMPQTWNTDPVVNAQVMMLNGVMEDDICAFVNDAVAHKPLPSIYYRDRVILLYMLSRPYANGISCIKESLDLLFREALAAQDTKGSLGSPLRTAAFISASVNGGLGEPATVKKAVSYLLDTQSKDGSWPAGFFFHGGDPNFFYGSSPLTTAVVVEALGKSRSFSVK